jgi:hypothetical protein
MIRYTRFVMLMFLSIVVSIATLSFSAEEKTAEAKKPWKIAGQLEEACKCNAACPCWFGSKPTHMNCGGQLVYFITKGNFGEVPLDGLAFARMGQSPDGQAMMETMGKWIFDYVYVDEKANAEQRKALEEISWATMPAASPNVKIRYVPITRSIDGKVHKIQIGEYGSFSAHLMEGGLGGGAPKIVNAPGADPIRKEFEQGTTLTFLYKDAEQDWNTQNSNYMYTNFEVDSKQYEEFGAMMMKKMEAMQKEKQSEHQH